MKILILLLTLGSLAIFNFANNPVFGLVPEGSDLQSIEKSANYDKQKGQFVNRRQGAIEAMRERTMNWGVVVEFFSGENQRVPKSKLPEVKPRISEFLKKSSDIKVIWLGHSTFLLNLQGIIVLVDPIFSDSASPVNFMINRFQPPALTLAELPEIDYIVISHDHYDHLDMETIKFFKDKNVQFLTPLGVGSHLVYWGIAKEKIVQLDWWESWSGEGIKFVATPSQHFSGRDGINDNKTLWASWVFQTTQHNIYFSGDSGYDTHFKDIGKKYGPFDLAFIENGQYNEAWREVHVLPEEGAQAYFDLKAKRFFPIHWGMFELSIHSWYDPIVQISQQAKKRGISLISPKLGQVVTVNDEYKNNDWWSEIIKLEAQ